MTNGDGCNRRYLRTEREGSHGAPGAGLPRLYERRAPSGTLLGIALILADCKSAGDDTVERVTAAPVRAIMQRLAVLLKPGRRSGDTHAGGSGAIPVLELTGESVIVSAPPTARARAPAAAAPAAATAISPGQVNDMLELELLPAEVPPARAGEGGSSLRLARLA